MATKYTMRRNGEKMAAIKISVAVFEKTVAKAAAAMGCSKAKALAGIRDELSRLLDEASGWRVLIVDDEKRVSTIHLDDLQGALDAGELTAERLLSDPVE